MTFTVTDRATSSYSFPATLDNCCSKPSKAAIGAPLKNDAVGSCAKRLQRSREDQFRRDRDRRPLVVGDVQQIAGDAHRMLHRPGQDPDSGQSRTVEAGEHVGRDVAVQDGGLERGTVDEQRGDQRVEGPDALVVPGPDGNETERGNSGAHRVDGIVLPGDERRRQSACQWSTTSMRNCPLDTFSTSLDEVLRFPLAGRVQHPQHDRLGRHTAAGLSACRLGLIAGGAAPRERHHQRDRPRLRTSP